MRLSRRALVQSADGPPLSRIVVNHLTRRHGGRICVAGIDPQTHRHVRPVLRNAEALPPELLASAGGPFALGAIVELGDIRPRPSAPHIEDHVFDPDRARAIETLAPQDYLDLIQGLALRALRPAFGSDLRRQTDLRYATAAGSGSCSLACVRLRGPRHLDVDSYGGLQLRFENAGKEARAAVTDLRFFTPDRETIDHRAMDDVSARLRADVDTWAMFGLARAWRARGHDQKLHWLMLNGLCLLDRPLE